MALQDLTPQLRLRLSRLERVVGWFVTVATLLLFVGLAYYIYQTAKRKGWFLDKVAYHTFLRNAAGLNVGDRVKLMGFDVGEITLIEAMAPYEYYNVYIQFRVKEPYYGYLWEDSQARVGSADFLGNRYIEVTKGSNGPATYAMHKVEELSASELPRLMTSNKFVFAQEIWIGTNRLIRPSDPIFYQTNLPPLGTNRIQVLNLDEPINRPKWIWDDKIGRYRPIQKENEKGFWLRVQESPALTERMETVITTVEKALPDFLGLTNTLVRVLTNANNIVTHMDELLVSAKPVLTNLGQITANLSGPKGSLGEWIIPTNINAQLEATLSQANQTAAAAETNLNVISSNVVASLIHVANLTSNLHAQVQANSFILSEISTLVVTTDEMMQGLKRHWLLKSAFNPATNAPVESILRPRIGDSPQ